MLMTDDHNRPSRTEQVPLFPPCQRQHSVDMTTIVLSIFCAFLYISKRMLRSTECAPVHRPPLTRSPPQGPCSPALL